MSVEPARSNFAAATEADPKIDRVQAVYILLGEEAPTQEDLRRANDARVEQQRQAKREQQRIYL